MKIRKFQKKDTKQTALLVFNTFKKFNGKDSSEKEAVNRYLSYVDLKKKSIEKMYSDYQRKPIFYVAEENGIIVGMVAGGVNKITNLYVKGTEHKKGIGKKLILKFENEAIKQGSKEIKIRASLYAVNFYQKMGYKKTTGIRNFMGLKIYPMKKVL